MVVHEGEYRGNVRNIFARLELKKNDGGISPDELPGIVSEIGGLRGDWNCYPGLPGGKCCSSAIFFSLESSAYDLDKNQAKSKSKVKHMHFYEAIEAIVLHKDKCPNTKTIIFITDNWEAKEFNKWRLSLERIKKDLLLEIYLLASPKVIKVF